MNRLSGNKMRIGPITVEYRGILSTLTKVSAAVEQVPDFGKCRIVERARQVDAIDFDSEIRMQFVEIQSHSRASAATDIKF